MATGLMSVPRPNVSAGMPKMSLPNIQHPLSRMGSVEQLSVRGEANNGPQHPGLGSRAKTLMVLSATSQDMDKHLLPPLGESSDKPMRGSSGIEQYYPTDIYGTRIPGDKGKFRTSIDFQPKYTAEELLILIQDRLVTGMHGVKCLFKNHDPTGKGHVSREALQRILHSLIGYVPGDPYNKLLRRLGLERRSHVSFDDFVSCFKDNEAVKKQWMSPAKKATLQEQSYPEEHLRYTDFSFHGEQIAASYCLSILRDKFRKNKMVNILDCLPPSSLEPGGRVVVAHLNDLIKSLGLKINEDELRKLWSRFDTEGAGAVRTLHFLKVLGLDERGKPRPYTTPRYVLVSKDTNAVVNVKGGEDNLLRDKKDSIAVGTETQTETVKENEAEPKSSRRVFPKPKKNTPRLDRILDCLFHKFESNYQALKSGLEMFDFIGDNFISKIDFRQVLQEFGLKIQALDLEQFLSKCGIRVIHGQIGWKEFLMKFWNKTDTGIVHRIVTSKQHKYYTGVSTGAATLTPEELEAKLVDFFHKDFLQLLGALKKCDKYSIGVVTQYEFKECVERVLGYSMSEDQWEQLKQDVGLDPDGLIPYAKFMEKFNAEPGLWNKKLEGHFMVKQVTLTTTNTMAPAIDRLKVYSDRARKEQERIVSAQKDKKTTLDLMKDRLGKMHSTEETPEPQAEEKVATPEEKKKEEDAKKLMSNMIDKPLVNTSREGPQPPPSKTITPEDNLGNLLQRGPDRMDRHASGIVHPYVDNGAPSRSLSELNAMLHDLFTYRFHGVDKAFKRLDRKMTGRFNKQQFMEFLKECEVYLTQSEVNMLWETFNTSVDGMFNFSTLVRHFSEYHPRPPTIKGKLPIEENKLAVEQARQRIKEQKLMQTPRRENSKIMGGASAPLLREKSKIDIKERDELLEKLRPDVLANWEILKGAFRQIDKYGRAAVPMLDMKDIVRNLNFGLDEEDIDKLLFKFDFHNDGNFHYIEFLKMYTDREKNGKEMPAQTKYSKLSYKLEKRFVLESNGKLRLIQPTIAEVVEWIRVKLIKDWKNVKRAFKRFDTDGSGFLTSTDFKNVLKACGIQIGDEDLYHIMTEFDPQMNGTISYEDFLTQLITTV